MQTNKITDKLHVIQEDIEEENNIHDVYESRFVFLLKNNISLINKFLHFYYH